MGKQIRIYLSDGSASGIRHAEITNWTGQALACPRARFQELREWKEVKRPGVYFLFGHAEETGEESVYIGEAEVVIERLADHMNGKEFWGELVAFTSKDDNLTKGHVRYLESRLIKLASTAARYKVMNGTEPQLPALPRADKDAMEEYLVSTQTLLGVLGHRVLDPLVETSKQIQTSATMEPKSKDFGAKDNLAENSRPAINAIFELNISGLESRAMRTDEGLVVLQGSDASSTIQSSLAIGYRNLREKLLQQGVLDTNGVKFKFTRDQLFNSPSQAAAVIVGYSINGRDAWRLPDGTNFATYERRLFNQLMEEIMSNDETSK